MSDINGYPDNNSNEDTLSRYGVTLKDFFESKGWDVTSTGGGFWGVHLELDDIGLEVFAINDADETLLPDPSGPLFASLSKSDGLRLNRTGHFKSLEDLQLAVKDWSADFQDGLLIEVETRLQANPKQSAHPNFTSIIPLLENPLDRELINGIKDTIDEILDGDEITKYQSYEAFYEWIQDQLYYDRLDVGDDASDRSESLLPHAYAELFLQSMMTEEAFDKSLFDINVLNPFDSEKLIHLPIFMKHLQDVFRDSALADMSAGRAPDNIAAFDKVNKIINLSDNEEDRELLMFLANDLWVGDSVPTPSILRVNTGPSM
ncbi:MAG: hypothetical protein V7693_15735 [Halopseudomonas sabulinigri]